MKIDVLENFSELNILLRYPYSSECEPTLIDVGAYRGGFSHAFAKKGWRVIAFEPDPINYHYCSIKTSKHSLVTCIQKAISDNPGETISFYKDQQHPGRGSLQPIGPNHNTKIEVETVRLDSVLKENQVTCVTVLKIDAEGADFLCLKSFDFKRFAPEIIMIEFLDARSKLHFNYTHHDMVAFMDQHGYQAYISEMGPLKKDGQAYQIGNSQYQFLQVAPYPLDHEPELGNIFFVRKEKAVQFVDVVSQYLKELEQYKFIRLPIHITQAFLTRIPLIMKLLYRIRRLGCYQN